MKYCILQYRKTPWDNFLAFGLSLCLLSCSPNAQQEKIDSIPVVEKVVSNLELHKPTHVLIFKNDYIFTELQENKLAILDTLNSKNIRHFNPKSVGKRFDAPHYLAISPKGHLLISNGWGKGIVEMEDIDSEMMQSRKVVISKLRASVKLSLFP